MDGVRVCECAVCGRVFGTMRLFDAHQEWDRSGEWVLTCVVPPGAVRDAWGTWQTPKGLAARTARVARFASARSGARPVSGEQPPRVPDGTSRAPGG